MFGSAPREYFSPQDMLELKFPVAFSDNPRGRTIAIRTGRSKGLVPAWGIRGYTFESEAPETPVDKANYAASRRSELKLREQINALSSLVVSLQKEIAACREKIESLCSQIEEKPSSSNTFIFDIGKGFEVIHPIPVVIEKFDDEVTVRFSDANVCGFGNTESEALLDFKNNIVNLFNDLSGTPTEKLGRLPLGWFQTLKKVMIPIEQTN